MHPSICGADCSSCPFLEKCAGCAETGGCPFGQACFVAKLIKKGSQEAYAAFKRKLIAEINNLRVPGLPEVVELYPLWGNYVNLSYMLPGGQQTKFLEDNAIYLGAQLESETNSGKCFGLVANEGFILVCRYGELGADPEIVMFVKRESQR